MALKYQNSLALALFVILVFSNMDIGLSARILQQTGTEQVTLQIELTSLPITTVDLDANVQGAFGEPQLADPSGGV